VGPATTAGVVTENQPDTRSTHRPGPEHPRLLAFGSLATVAVSALVSLAGYGLLPSRIRIHWSLGLGPYYGPEFAPTALVLALFPALVAAGALGGRWGIRRLDRDARSEGVRPYGSLALIGGLTLLVVVQVGLVAANL
jgi:hypothetical protein